MYPTRDNTRNYLLQVQPVNGVKLKQTPPKIRLSETSGPTPTDGGILSFFFFSGNKGGPPVFGICSNGEAIHDSISGRVGRDPGLHVSLHSVRSITILDNNMICLPYASEFASQSIYPANNSSPVGQSRLKYLALREALTRKI